jgi:2-haloacid dehalogenase
LCRYKWLLLDADGTLFDYDMAEAKALQKTFHQIGERFDNAYIALYREINGRLWEAFEAGRTTPAEIRIQRFEELFESVGVRSDPALFSRVYLGHLGDGTDLFIGTEEVLRALKGQASLALITNGFRAVQESRLAKSTIGDCFDTVIISEQVGFAKPDPGIYQIAFQQMGQPRRDEVLIVGDSLGSDIKGGNNYGIDTCWFNPLGRIRDREVSIQYEIRELSELLGIVRGDRDQEDEGQKDRGQADKGGWS